MIEHDFKRIKKAWFFQAFFFCALLSACAGLKGRLDNAQQLMTDYQYQTKTYRTDHFPLFSAFPQQQSTATPLRIVIEGDGYAWVSRYMLSDNPTPRDPIGLKLAAGLTPPAIYLARPCQYISVPTCDASYWSTNRFTRPVLESYMQALDQIKQERSVSAFELIGFSGGGTIAFILAGLRDDITHVSTVAGVLDPERWTHYHDISPLTLPYAPQETLRRAAKTSFTHICASSDDIVPCDLNQRFVDTARMQGYTNHVLKNISIGTHQSLWRDFIRYKNARNDHPAP